MKKMLKEISLLVILPLILMSISLGVIGTSHTIKMANVNRITTLRHESTDISIQCDGNLCQNIKNLEYTLFEFEKILSI